MSLGKELLDIIETNGCSSEELASYLKRLRLEIIKSNSNDTKLILILKKTEQLYQDMNDYYLPSKSLFKNICIRLEKIRPLLEDALSSCDQEDKIVIQTIIANQNLLSQYNKEKSFWENFTNKVNSKFQSPLDLPED